MCHSKPRCWRKPGDAATLPELIRFLIDRTGYIKALETEGSPESFSRIENLKELANAARDAEERGETLPEFLDNAALASDTDQYDPDARVTLMTLHAAKGLEFPLVFLCGMEEGLFPHSRTLMEPDQMEEERRLCYVGMTRAMDTLVLTRARYRRRYGNDMPESSIASRQASASSRSSSGISVIVNVEPRSSVLKNRAFIAIRSMSPWNAPMVPSGPAPMGIWTGIGWLSSRSLISA